MYMDDSKRYGMRLSTINQIVESILEHYSDKEGAKMIANEATIYLKTAYICEHEGIDKAIAYFAGNHDDREYIEFMTFVVLPEKQDK